MSRRRKTNYTGLRILLTAMIIAIVLATGLVIKLCIDLATSDTDAPAASTSAPAKEKNKKDKQKKDKPSKGTAPEDADPADSDAPYIIDSATIGSHGDLLIHRPIIKASARDGGYDFSSIFQYMEPYISKCDYAVANLETTFGGDQFPYQGNPAFNCPDDFADAVKESGYDMLLTANNHCYDTGIIGINRTLQEARKRGLETLGTRPDEDEHRYTIVDVNGIHIGMICYTYVMGLNSKGKVVVNGDNTVIDSGAEQLNYFTETDLGRFYREIQAEYDDMRSNGAEATMLYIHWGQEYQLSPNSIQQEVAQQMCDLGFDVIVGGHPHVVQPMDYLTSQKDASHKTVVIYSLGNAVSNQLVSEMLEQKSGHTEDGAFFTVTFDKYSDGKVYLDDVNVIPTWVVRRTADNVTQYNIIPLDDARRDDWQQMFNFGSDLMNGAAASYDRTMDLVGSGLQKAALNLHSAKADREQSGQDAA